MPEHILENNKRTFLFFIVSVQANKWRRYFIGVEQFSGMTRVLGGD